MGRWHGRGARLEESEGERKRDLYERELERGRGGMIRGELGEESADVQQLATVQWRPRLVSDEQR